MLDNTNKDLLLYFVIFIIILFIILLPKIKDRKNKNNKIKKNKYKNVLIISILIGLMLLYFDAKLGVIVLFLSMIMYYENTQRVDNKENYQDFLDSSETARTDNLANELKVKNIINDLVKNIKGNFTVLQNKLNSQRQLIENSKSEFKKKLDESLKKCGKENDNFSNTIEIDTQSGFTDFNMPDPLKETFVKSGVPNIRDLVMNEYIKEEELNKDVLPDNNFEKEGPSLNSEYLNSNIDKTGTVFYPLN